MKKLMFFILLICLISACKRETSIANPKKLSKPIEFMTHEGRKGHRATIVTATIEEYKKYLSLSGFHAINDPVSIVYYLNSKTVCSEKINVDEISGFSMFHIVNNKLKHSLFIKRDDSFIEMKEFTLGTPHIGLNQLTFLFNEVLKSGNETNSLIAIFPLKFPGINDWGETPNDLSLHILAKKYSHKYFGIKTPLRTDPYNYQIDGTEACHKDDCHHEDGCDCIVYNASEDIYECKPCRCQKKKAAGNLVVLETFTPLYMSTYMRDTLYEDFRDQVMSLYAIGYKYKEYYYGISTFLEEYDLLSSSDYVYIVTRMPELYSIVNKLTNHTTYAASSMLTTTEITSLNELINRVTGLSNNPDFQSILDDIDNDIQFFTGKTVAQTISAID